MHRLAAPDLFASGSATDWPPLDGGSTHGIAGSANENQRALQTRLDAAPLDELHALQGALFARMIQGTATELERWAFAQTQARQQPQASAWSALFGSGGPPLFGGPLGNSLFAVAPLVGAFGFEAPTARVEAAGAEPAAAPAW